MRFFQAFPPERIDRPGADHIGRRMHMSVQEHGDTYILATLMGKSTGFVSKRGWYSTSCRDPLISLAGLDRHVTLAYKASLSHLNVVSARLLICSGCETLTHFKSLFLNHPGGASSLSCPAHPRFWLFRPSQLLPMRRPATFRPPTSGPPPAPLLSLSMAGSR